MLTCFNRVKTVLCCLHFTAEEQKLREFKELVKGQISSKKNIQPEPLSDYTILHHYNEIRR